MVEFKIKFAFVCEGFENPPKIASMVSKHNQNIKAKV
jgi:hypothetical protein